MKSYFDFLINLCYITFYLFTLYAGFVVIYRFFETHENVRFIKNYIQTNQVHHIEK